MAANRLKRFKVKVNPAWCKGCGICVAFCPKRVLETGRGGIPVVKLPDDCTGCRLCELRCPDFAIEVGEEQDDAGNEQPGS